MEKDTIDIKDTITTTEVDSGIYQKMKNEYKEILTWDIALPIGFSWFIFLIVFFKKKLQKIIRLKQYQRTKSKIKEKTNNFISIAENLSLEKDFFRVETFDLEEPFIIPFPNTKRNELIECDFNPQFPYNKNKSLKESLNNYIKTYYGEKIIYKQTEFSIEGFINKIAEDTADNFIRQIKDRKVRFNKYLFGVYDIRKRENKSNIYVYQSDYFTFKCTTNIFNALKGLAPIAELPFHKEDFKISEIRPFLNSIGVGGFLIINRGMGDEIVVALRGNSCDSGGYWHFAFDETFTSDDKKENYSIKECLKRALVEELGILAEEQQKSLPEDQIVILDAGIIRTEENDNRFEFEVCAYARICFSKEYTFDDFIKGYRFAKDAELETRCLDFIAINQIDNFIETHKMSPEAKALLKNIQTIYQQKVLKTDNEGFKSLLND